MEIVIFFAILGLSMYLESLFHRKKLSKYQVILRFIIRIPIRLFMHFLTFMIALIGSSALIIIFLGPVLLILGVDLYDFFHSDLFVTMALILGLIVFLFIVGEKDKEIFDDD